MAEHKRPCGFKPRDPLWRASFVVSARVITGMTGLSLHSMLMVAKQALGILPGPSAPRVSPASLGA